jgi:nucleotide-binding universal stress UspA family protein
VHDEAGHSFEHPVSLALTSMSVSVQPVAVVLERAANAGGPNLIVMGTHGASGFEHLILGLGG